MMVAPESTCNTPILVVDDDEEILRMTSFVLRQLGYEVQTANDGAGGIASLKSAGKVPCLILLDLMMPVMDGAAFRKKLREIPSAANVPVIILSGDTELATKAAEMSVAGFEQKPISVERLAAVAAKYCKAAS
jgi:CheY-like chemotaxis protein